MKTNEQKLLFLVSDGGNSFQSQGTVLIDLAPDDSEYQSVEEQVRIAQNFPKYLSLILKKYVFRVTGHVRHKLARLVTETR